MTCCFTTFKVNFISFHHNIGQFFFLLSSAARPRQIDLGFVVDSSDGVNWSQIQRFITSMLESFDISDDRVHVGFVVFSDRAAVSFGFNVLQGAAYTRDGIRQLISGITQLGGSQRRVDLAFNTAYRYLFSAAGGTRMTARKVFQIPVKVLCSDSSGCLV